MPNSLVSKFSLLLVASTIFMTGCEAKAKDKFSEQGAYKLPVISDIETRVSLRKIVRSDGRSVNLSLSHQSVQGIPSNVIYRSHPPQYVERVLAKTSRLMTSYLRSRGIVKQDCRGIGYNLNVIVINKDVLQSAPRFRDFYLKRFGRTSVPGHTLYGYYDTTPEVENNSTILVTNIDTYLNEEVLAHEIAHYWWDRLCLANYISGGSEAFAQSFDLYYMRSK